ncbi:M20 aminoacylase family protein [Lutibaculum baratangense]|uniref:N-acetyl-L,L-diaminopimelate deacetylase n=1 Tax=Lutibaculum baratangense AMV1 TaxID=631454 RepID=V4TF56_9HYPH|nr:M20 aminoacylase family protein [Lutibaculum baratangense]ESR24813.1 N-acetyl-L,L-diaminopimelate deacetylase [Lutibaculum baratangense AMV1]
MPIKDDVRPYLDELTAIRRDFHAHPELGFEEERTSRIVAEKLKEYGADEVHTGIARTGVVGVVRGKGGSNRAVGLRADMDCLPMDEVNTFEHRSVHPGRMHACGHDGHTTMLLGAARYLAEHRDAFDGIVYLYFQPAEEGRAGGRVMVEDGLFERFDVEQVYGMHNMPGLPLGEIAMRSGPCMASADEFEIRVFGRGSHGAMPHVSRDPVIVGSSIVMALQSIVSRRVDPIEEAVVSVTQFHAGSAFNVIPEEAVLRGTCRSFLPSVRDLLESELRRVATNVAAAYDARAEVTYMRNYPATINTPAETETAAMVARAVVGEAKVQTDAAPKMGAEDFSYMLNERPGAYIWLGNGMPGEKGGAMVHTPQYDFNDNAIPYGVSFWAQLVETVLPVER